MLSLLNDKLLGLFPRFSGFLRSTHALIMVLGAICVLFAWIFDDPVLRYVSIGLFGFLMVVVLGRYAFKGPESDRQQMNVRVSHVEARFQNIEPRMIMDTGFQEILKDIIPKLRRPLPLSSGIIEGQSSDPQAIHEISTEEAKKIAEKDMLPPPQ